MAGRPDPDHVGDALVRPSLDEIGLRTGTDKSSAAHGYLRTYDELFGDLRDEPIQLVEFGVRRGASLRMWEEYFTRGQVYAVDVHTSAHRQGTGPSTILVADQAEEASLDRLTRKLRPTIVIDDGTHVWRHQIATLQKLLPVVRPGGFFVVEGIHTSFGDDHATRYGRDGSTETAFDYVQRIAMAVTAGHRAGTLQDDFVAYCRETVASVQFVRNIAIIRKRAHPQRKYRVRSVGDLATNTHLCDGGGDYDRIPAELVDADTSVHAAFARAYGDGTVRVREAVSGEIGDARVIGAGIVTVGGSVVEETLNVARNLVRTSGLYQVVRGEIWVAEKPFLPKRRFPAEEGRRQVLLRQTADGNYGHWLIDTLPRLALLRQFEDLSRCTFILSRQESAAMQRVVEDSLALAGVTAEQLQFLDRADYEFERLTVLGNLSHHPVTKSPMVVDFLEQLAATIPPTQGQKRVYVTRRGVHRRRLLNEESVVELLTGYGYAVVSPEQQTLAEQIATFRGATHVVGVMGAALSNLAFSPRGVSVLALATPVMKHDFFYDLVCLKQGRYRGLQGHSSENGPPTLATDFTVDIDLLAASLDWLHADPATAPEDQE